MSKKTTVYDIAKELNISVSTVSRVLNNSILISDEKRKLILKTVERLGYKKRIIKKHKNRAILNITLFLPYMADGYIHLFYDIAQIISGIQEILGETGVNIITKLNAANTNIFQNKKLGDIDAFVFAFTQPDNRLFSMIDERSIPVILLNRIDKNKNYVVCDSELGMELLLDRIVEHRSKVKPCYLGFKQIKYISDLRKKGIFAGCKKYNIHFSDKDAFEVKNIQQIDKSLLDTILKKKYNAVLCVNDVIAVYTYQAALHHGIKIPETFSLTGFDNSPVIELLSKRIDTIHLSRKALGQETGKWLQRSIIGRDKELFQKRIVGKYIKGGTI